MQQPSVQPGLALAQIMPSLKAVLAQLTITSGTIATIAVGDDSELSDTELASDNE